MRSSKQYNLFILAGVFLFFLLGFYFLYTENIERLLILLAIICGTLGLFFLFKNIHFIPYVFAFITPLSIDVEIGAGTKISAPLEIFLICFIFLLGISFLIKKPQNLSKLKHPVTILLGSLILLMLLSSLYGEKSVVSFKKTISQSIYIIGFYVFTVLLINKSTKLGKIYFWYVAGMIIPICNSIINHAKWDFVQPASVYSALPFYDEHTVFGACIAFVIPFTVFKIGLYQQRKIHFGFLLLAIFLIIALLHSYSRAAWISLVVGLVFYFFIRFKGSFKVLLGVLSVLIGVFWFNYSDVYSQLRRNSVKYSEDFSAHLVSVTNLKDDASNRERINRWVCAVRMFKEKPILGFGPGTYQFEYGKYQTDEFTTRISTHRGDKGNAHSEYLMALSETGILGLIILLLLYLKSIQVAMRVLSKKITKEDRVLLFSASLGLTTFYIHGLFNAFSDSPKMAFLLFVSLAIIVYIDNKYSKGQGKIVTSKYNEYI